MTRCKHRERVNPFDVYRHLSLPGDRYGDRRLLRHALLVFHAPVAVGGRRTDREVDHREVSEMDAAAMSRSSMFEHPDRGPFEPEDSMHLVVFVVVVISFVFGFAVAAYVL